MVGNTLYNRERIDHLKPCEMEVRKSYQRSLNQEGHNLMKAKLLPPVLMIGMILIFFHGHGIAAEDDVPYGVTKYLILYYSPKSVTRPSKDIIRLRIKVVSKCTDSKDWMIKGHPNCSNMDWDYVTTVTEINCSSKQDRDIESIGYDHTGKPVESLATESSEWSDIDPGSYTEVLYKLVCD